MNSEKTILLHSSWQTVNIGDIAHTPGMLHLIEQHLPGVRVILWPKNLDNGVAPMLRRRFPKLRIVRDAPHWANSEFRPDDPTIAEAIKEASLWLQGSGSGIVEIPDIERWRKESSGKPYGVLGASVGVVIGVPDQKDAVISASLHQLLDNAAFLYTRETRSLRAVKEAGIRCPRKDFVPDATFALDLRNDAAADELLRHYGLETDRFACFIPRLRLTPYWETSNSVPAADTERKKAINARNVDADMAKMREAIIVWVRTTGGKALLCPEMSYQVRLLRPYLHDPLPDDVRSRVFPMGRYWITDEAASVYKRARAVVSMECHSPIIANSVGRPGLYLRQPEDTWKGQMYPDLGLSDWKLEMASVTGAEIADRLLRIHADYDSALRTVKRASDAAMARYAIAMKTIAGVLK